MKHRRGIDLTAPVKPATYGAYNAAPSLYETVSGLREWEVLGAKCGRCGHIAWLDKTAVVRRCGNQYLSSLPAKLVCRCGNADDNRVLVGALGRD